MNQNDSRPLYFSAIHVLQIFKIIQKTGNIPDRDMLRTFNLGVGMTMVVEPKSLDAIQHHLSKMNCDNYVIGKITKGEKKVVYRGNLL